MSRPRFSLCRLGYGLTAAIGLLLPPSVALGDDSAPAANGPTNAPLIFTNVQDRFSLTLPAGWRAMPEEMAAGLCDPMGTAQTGANGTYGFELAANTNSLSPPYVTVHVIRAGRLADNFVRMLNNPELRRRAVLEMVKKDGLEAHDIVTITYDTNRHRLSFTGFRQDEFSKVRFWHDLIFTEHGSINLTCLAEEPNAERWSEPFAGILASLQVNSFVAYQPRPVTPNIAGAKFRATKVLFIPGLAIVLGLARIISQRFSDRVMSDEI